MIIDFQSDPRTARRYNILCARTGENLKDWHISYADDEAGIVRCYVRDEAGTGFRLNEDRTEVVSEERRKAIKIVSKSAAELAEIDDDSRHIERLKAEQADKMTAICVAAAQDRYHRDVLAPRRLKLLEVTREVFLQFFHAGVTHYEITDHPVPDDARLVDATYDPDLGLFTLKIESQEFPPVPGGEPIPQMMGTVWRPLSGDHGSSPETGARTRWPH